MPEIFPNIEKEILIKEKIENFSEDIIGPKNFKIEANFFHKN